MQIPNSKPLVSICCITYNQVDYISQAIEGFLMQRTSFKFEIIIHDDASTDGTAEIVLQYAKQFPDIIIPKFQTKNIYSAEGLNFQFNHVFLCAKGKYIAFCEGDDYWIDPLKLEKQIVFMEKNIEYGLTHTRAFLYSQEKDQVTDIIGKAKNNFSDLLYENTISNLTVCLRKDLLDQYVAEINPVSHSDWLTCDYPIWLYLIHQTKFHFIPDITGVYRSLNTSICHNKNDQKRLKFQEGVLNIVEFYSDKYNYYDKNKILKRYSKILSPMYIMQKEWKGYRKTLKIYYKSKSYINLFWDLFTVPFFFSSFIVKGSYYIKNKIFNF